MINGKTRMVGGRYDECTWCRQRYSLGSPGRQVTTATNAPTPGVSGRDGVAGADPIQYLFLHITDEHEVVVWQVWLDKEVMQRRCSSRRLITQSTTRCSHSGLQ